MERSRSMHHSWIQWIHTRWIILCTMFSQTVTALLELFLDAPTYLPRGIDGRWWRIYDCCCRHCISSPVQLLVVASTHGLSALFSTTVLQKLLLKKNVVCPCLTHGLCQQRVRKHRRVKESSARLHQCTMLRVIWSRIDHSPPLYVWYF